MTARAGTGALAQWLLEHHRRGDCRHVDLELSPRLYGLARSRLQRLTPRAELLLGDGSSDGVSPVQIAGFLVARYVNSGMIDPESMPHLGPILRRAEAAADAARTEP